MLQPSFQCNSARQWLNKTNTQRLGTGSAAATTGTDIQGSPLLSSYISIVHSEAKAGPYLVQLGGIVAITASEARRDLFGLIERVNLDHTEVEIISKRGSAVLMSKDEYDALVETSYLLRSPKNAIRLLSALESAREGQVVEHKLIDP